MADKPYRDKDTLVNLYIDKEMSQIEIAEKFGVSSSTISTYLQRNNIPTRGSGPKVQYPELHNEDWLRKKYVKNGMSSRDIADELGVNKSAVLDGLRECGISRRDTSTATKMGMDKGHAAYYTSANGYEMVCSRGSKRAWSIGVHRLVAIADGANPNTVFDGDHHVHHKNNVPWDNRPENLKVVTNSEHMKEHAKEERWGK
jgi:predicted DNA-binding protein YlxM (UPF0122 family)